jgi:hypothetical protein
MISILPGRPRVWNCSASWSVIVGRFGLFVGSDIPRPACFGLVAELSGLAVA